MGQLIEPCLLIGAREYWLCFLSRKEVIFLFDPNDIAVMLLVVGVHYEVIIATFLLVAPTALLIYYFHLFNLIPAFCTVIDYFQSYVNTEHLQTCWKCCARLESFDQSKKYRKYSVQRPQKGEKCL